MFEKNIYPHLIPPCVQEVTRLLSVPKGNELIKGGTLQNSRRKIPIHQNPCVLSEKSCR